MEESMVAALSCFNWGESPMARLRLHWLAIALCGILISVARADDKPKSVPGKEAPEKSAAGDATTGAVPDQAELEKKFTEDMSGVVFSGSYSVTKEGKETPAAMEKYTIASVSKVKDDLWLF